MNYGLNLRQESSEADGGLDLLSLGALVHRLDPGVIPFRKATECKIHVSGGEFNVAANLADCFRLRTGIATAMVDYPIGDLIAERVESEDAVLEALDLDVPYGQGHLFGAPRPIKESLMEETAPPREFFLKQSGRTA